MGENHHPGGESPQEEDKHASDSKPPPAPHPENDAGIIPPIKSPLLDDDELTAENVNIFTMKPVSALKLLCQSIDHLVHMTGDIPPTPPVRSRNPSPGPGYAQQSHLRHSSNMDEDSEQQPETPKREISHLHPHGFGTLRGRHGHHGQPHIDGVSFTKTPIGSPEAHASEPSAGTIIAEYAEPVHIQQGAIARKFYSKRPPPISTEDYLMRMHKYCPMSTGVYLATSCYITRMAIRERIIPVTPRNVHRLLLAGLRVAMKALEDLSWPHERFSKVGGVSEGELGRLEITFCFLMDFGLKVDEAMLQHEAESLLESSQRAVLEGGFGVHANSKNNGSIDLRLPSDQERRVGRPGSGGSGGGESMKRKASSALPSRPAVGHAVGDFHHHHHHHPHPHQHQQHHHHHHHHNEGEGDAGGGGGGDGG